jgi:hypothetical protein
MVAMRGLVLGFVIAIVTHGFAQQANVTPPVRLCVAQLRNQTPNKFDVVKLRQQLMDGLNQTKLAKAGAMTVFSIEVSESEDAQAAVQAEKCEFAVYMRLLQVAPRPPSPDVSGGITYRSSAANPMEQIMGLQCTVERTGNPIPALIDRQYTKTPMVPQIGIEKLLSAEQLRIADAIEKKMSSVK